MNFILNILWFIFGGIWMGLGWIIAGLIMIVTIIGIPWARSAFAIASFSFWPFGRMAVDRRSLIGRNDVGTGALGVIGNVLWFVLAGWWLAIGHLVHAAALAITIIGIPFAFQHVKLAVLAAAPIGQEIVPASLTRY